MIFIFQQRFLYQNFVRMKDSMKGEKKSLRSATARRVELIQNLFTTKCTKWDSEYQIQCMFENALKNNHLFFKSSLSKLIKNKQLF